MNHVRPRTDGRSIGTLLAGVLLACGCTASRAGEGQAAASPSSAEILDADIAVFGKRLMEDPVSATDRSRLASLYLKRARVAGSVTDVERALAEANRSLTLREDHNSSTYAILATAKLAQHDFVGALDAARQLVAAEPTQGAYRALLGEVLLELGRYDEAAREFRPLETRSSDLAIAPRLVRWYEITGHLSRGKTLAQYVARLASENELIDAEQKAWFHLRAGDLAGKSGNHEQARHSYRSGLRANPGDYRILAAQARLSAAEGNWSAVIRHAEQAIAVHPDPGTLGLLRDAYLGVGDSAQAKSYGVAMTTSALTQPGAIHRAWGLHLADHGERLDDVTRRVRAELRSRQDVYGFDLEAWALLASGRPDAAWRSARRALAQNTEDAELLYRAGRIAEAAGEPRAAEDLLRRAYQLRGLLRADVLEQLATRHPAAGAR
jgi:tetratricopeptide (TPR) repeat protein